MTSIASATWSGSQALGKRIYVCGFCSARSGVEVGYNTSDGNNLIYICSGCNQPTFFHRDGHQTPAPVFGSVVTELNDNVGGLYNEARLCTGVGAYTSCVLVCRKILMHVAVDQGADEGLRFIEYVNHLVNEHYVPPGSEGWVDHIRKKSNEANHEIVLMSKEEAERLLTFTEMLLKFVYELPAKIAPQVKEIEEN